MEAVVAVPAPLPPVMVRVCAQSLCQLNEYIPVKIKTLTYMYGVFTTLIDF